MVMCFLWGGNIGLAMTVGLTAASHDDLPVMVLACLAAFVCGTQTYYFLFESGEPKNGPR
jgi:membrane protein DedA with SNARE-associated domain